ncbi:unnamed protein product [Natator depressus]
MRWGKSDPYNSSFAGHISVSNGWFIVTNASKAIAGDFKIVHEMNKSECLASIHLNVTGSLRQLRPPWPGTIASMGWQRGMPSHNASRWHGEDAYHRHKEHSVDMQKASQSSHIAKVVVWTVVAFLVLALALGLWQRNNIARCMHWFRNRLGFLARAAPSQQASDAVPMQELAELTQPEDASGGDQSAVLNGKLLGSAEMLNAGGLESGEG